MRLMPVLASQAGAVIKRTDRLASLTELAGKDPLTGLPNRRFWDEEVDRTLSLAGRHGTPVCVVVLDVNGLKQVNDKQGHQAGDALLRDAALSWRAQLRAEDLLARLGGDEFGVLVPGLRRAGHRAPAHRGRTPPVGGGWGRGVGRGRERRGAAPPRRRGDVRRQAGPLTAPAGAPSTASVPAPGSVHSRRRRGGEPPAPL